MIAARLTNLRAALRRPVTIADVGRFATRQASAGLETLWGLQQGPIAKTAMAAYATILCLVTALIADQWRYLVHKAAEAQRSDCAIVDADGKVIDGFVPCFPDEVAQLPHATQLMQIVFGVWIVSLALLLAPQIWKARQK